MASDDQSSDSRRGSGRLGFGLVGILAGTAFGWWAAGGPVPDWSPVLALGHAAPAAAETRPPPTPASAPALDGNQAALRAALARGDGLTIGVFGDSMADGLWAGLYRELRDLEGVRVIRFARASTGLSRYDYVNVSDQTAEQLAGQKIDIAVFMIGANDRQAMQGDGSSVLAYGEPEWRRAYGQRTDALVAQVRAQGAAVYWVGLPRMRSSGAERGAELVNGIFAERARAGGFTYVDTMAATSDAEHNYSAYLPTGPGGARQLVRASDGIHMTMNGYLVLAGPVEAAIRADLDEARAASSPPPEQQPATEAGQEV